MAHGVNLAITNFRNTGVNVSVAQRAVDITANWLDDSGTPHTATQTVLFPNELANRSNAWLKSKLTALLLDSLRIDVGMETEADQL